MFKKPMGQHFQIMAENRCSATFRLGNGRRRTFGLDPWGSEIPFSYAFPRLFKLSYFSMAQLLITGTSTFKNCHTPQWLDC